MLVPLTSGNSLTLAESNGTWGPANDGHYAIGPDYVCPPFIYDADNPVDVETYNTIKAALEAYDGDVEQFETNFVNNLTDIGLSQGFAKSVLQQITNK